MPSWLVEDPTVVYLLLGTVALALAAGYWSRRRRNYLYGLVGVLVLIGLVWLLDYLIVTDREEVLATLQAISRRAEVVDVDGTFAFLCDDLTLGGLDKAHFREFAKSQVRTWQVREIRMWDFSVPELSREKRTARAEFHAKIKGSFRGEELFYLVRADFGLDRNGKWCLRNFRLFDPYSNTNEELSIPGLPR